RAPPGRRAAGSHTRTARARASTSHGADWSHAFFIVSPTMRTPVTGSWRTVKRGNRVESTTRAQSMRAVSAAKLPVPRVGTSEGTYPDPLLTGFHHPRRARFIAAAAASGTVAPRAKAMVARHRRADQIRRPRPRAPTIARFWYRTPVARPARKPAPMAVPA